MPRFVLRVATDDGLHTLGSRRASQLHGQPVRAVVEKDGARWAVVGDHSVWRTNAFGSWHAVATFEHQRLHCLLPVGRALLVGTSEAHLLRLAGGSLTRVESFEEVPGRSQWFTPWGGPPDTRSLARDARGTVYVNVHVGGIVRSAGRDVWRPTAFPLEGDAHQVLAHPSRRGWLWAATARGLASSQDGGNSWRFDRQGLHATYQRAVAVAGDWVLVSVAESERGERAAIYRRPLAGENAFERCDDGLPKWFTGNIDTHCLVAEASVAAFGTRDGAVFLSQDHGRSWKQAAEGLPPVRQLALSILRSHAH